MILRVPLLPLTPFQQLTHQWDEICPQNAAQVMLVEGTPDSDVIESAWQSTLRDLGLGPVFFDAEENGYWHEVWSGNPSSPLVNQASADADIHSYLAQTLNHPFAAPYVLPYRPFFLQRSGDCYIGIVYQQWVADSVSIRILMREWFLRIFHPTRARRKLIDLPRPRIARGPALGRAPMDLFRAARHIWRWRKVSPQLTAFPPSLENQAVELRPIRFGPEALDDLLMVTRAEGCTLNDLLIAALAHCLDTHLAPALGTAITIAIATSIDLRPYLPGDLSETFGSLLAYAPILCHLPAANKLDLAQDIARQTRQLKDPDRIAQYLLLPSLIAWQARHKAASQIPSFYRRHAPLVGGIANVNLNKSWIALYHPSPLKQYLRVAAPNPAMPLAVTASTLGDTLDIVISTQRSTLPGEKAQQVADDFARTLRSLVQSRPLQRNP